VCCDLQNMGIEYDEAMETIHAIKKDGTVSPACTHAPVWSHTLREARHMRPGPCRQLAPVGVSLLIHIPGTTDLWTSSLAALQRVNTKRCICDAYLGCC